MKRRHDPEAHVAIQTEADPKDRLLETLEVRELKGIKTAVQSIDVTLKGLLAAVEKLVLQAPTKATRLDATVTRIPREEA